MLMIKFLSAKAAHKAKQASKRLTESSEGGGLLEQIRMHSSEMPEDSVTQSMRRTVHLNPNDSLV